MYCDLPLSDFFNSLLCCGKMLSLITFPMQDSFESAFLLISKKQLSTPFKEIFLSHVLKNILSESCVETIPGCSSCVYRTYCGVDVFRNYLETGDIANVRMEGFFCRKQTQIFDYLFERIQDPEFMSVIKTWIGG